MIAIEISRLYPTELTHNLIDPYIGENPGNRAAWSNKTNVFLSSCSKMMKIQKDYIPNLPYCKQQFIAINKSFEFLKVNYYGNDHRQTSKC
jgi:hypothetical protein